MKRVVKRAITDVGKEIYVLITEEGNLFANKGGFVVDNSLITVENTSSTILEDKVPSKIVNAMNMMYNRYLKKQALKKKLKALREQIDMLDIKADSNTVNAIIADYNRETLVKKHMKEVKGDEHCKLSFFNNSLDREWVEALLRKNKTRQILYTYRLHPTAYKKPITLEEALSILKKERILDVTADNECIHLNAYSGNDMW